MPFLKMPWRESCSNVLLVKSRVLFMWADRELGRLCSAIGHAVKRLNQSGSGLAIARKRACTNARTRARTHVRLSAQRAQSSA